MIFLKFVFFLQDCPVGVTNTVFSSSFLLTFPIAFLGIADRILKVGLKAWQVPNIGTWLLSEPDSWEACLRPTPSPQPFPSQGCQVSLPALQPPEKLCEDWSKFWVHSLTSWKSLWGWSRFRIHIFTFWPHVGSSTPSTAASVMSGWARSTFSKYETLTHGVLPFYCF